MIGVIPYGRQWIEEDDIAAVVQTLREPWLTQGPRGAEFEAGLAAATGARFATVVSSGTAALHLAGLGVGVGRDDVVITSAISFAATANAMAHCGARVAFCDVDPRTGLMEMNSLAELAATLARSGRRPTAIVPVDFAGQAADRTAVREVADRFGARIIEDCAHSLGARYRTGGATHPTGSCSHADAAILSFHPVKHITTGEGGAILTNDPHLAGTLRELRSHGITREPDRFERSADDPMRGPWYHEQQALGLNYRLTDIQCALGTSQLRKLPRFLERRRALAARYDEALARAPMCEWFEPLANPHPAHHARHLYVVQMRRHGAEALASVARRRRRVHGSLSARGIQTQVHYLPIPWHPFWRGSSCAPSGPWPGADAFYASALSLPLFPAMSDAEMDRTLAALRASSEDSCDE
jgi:UDP-4-amino-4,6-dideoxy-N-acetyl-beta-L-altrosamine transaminase